MPQRLPRFEQVMQAREDAAKLAQILAEAGEALPETVNGRPLYASADGWRTDRRRGIPCIARGVSGATDGSDPLQALLRKERGRRR